MKANIGGKIRKVRELKCFTQDFMAGKPEMSQRAYSKIENNDIKLYGCQIEDISKIFEIEPFDLISFDDSLVFNNSPQSGKNNTNTINNNFPDDLKKSYEDQIAHSEQEMLFMKRLLEKS